MSETARGKDATGAYVTRRTLARKTARWLSDCAQVAPRYRKIAFDIETAALLVVDMQRFFTDSRSHAYLQATGAILDNVNALAEAFAKAARPVAASFYAGTAEEAPAMKAFWKHLLAPGDPLAEPDERLRLPAGTLVFRKPTYSAFQGSPLGRFLRERGTTQLAICGVMTHLCVSTAAREAFCAGLVPFLAADATAAPTERLHAGALLEAAHGFAVVTDTSTLTKNRGGGRSRGTAGRTTGMNR